MDYFELADGTSGALPTMHEERRRAVREAVDEARLTREALGLPPTSVEVRIARKLAQDVRASAQEHKGAAGDRRPPLVRRLQQVVGLGHLVRALLDDSDLDQVRPELRAAMEAAEALCSGFGEPLDELEEYLAVRGVTYPELEQERHPLDTVAPLWMDAYGAPSVMGVFSRLVLAPLLDPPSQG
ncbi:hypothetical protein [Streptomyces sp. NPDC048659]|uniref:hypothetical protein n=1 Tax=Streptomyces sp. NPDC048659 TaxID=3155489 RepID=UPI00343A618F